MAKVGRLVKDTMIQELTTALNAQPNFFVASLGSLQAMEADLLRKRLRTAHARVFVVKRTLGLRGLSAVRLNGGTSALFSGSVALVLSGKDPLMTARLIVNFAKANQDKLIIRGGWMDGELLDHAQVELLASLPPRSQLVAQLIGVLESPIAEVVGVLEAVLGEVAWVLEEASKTVKPAKVG